MDNSGDLSNFTSWFLQAEMLSRGSCTVLQPLIYLGHRAFSKEYYLKKSHYGLFSAYSSFLIKFHPKQNGQKLSSGEILKPNYD